MVNASIDRTSGPVAQSTLNGTPGNDVLQGGAGDDVIDGGDGDDVISDDGGNNVIFGGRGNDSITLRNLYAAASIYEGVTTTNSIAAGDGNDYIDIFALRRGTLAVDLGDGSDSLHLNELDRETLVTITLGGGADRVTLGSDVGQRLLGGANTIVINDFAAGAGGDVINFADLLRGFYINSPVQPPMGNPFAGGFLKLVQDGADTIIRLDYDGSGPGGSSVYIRDLVRLKDVVATTITAENLAGYAPDGSALVAVTVNGTAGNDLVEAGAATGSYYGLGGDDRMIGSSANDVLDGGTGNDVITGGFGNDTLIGGDGNDHLSDDFGNDVLNGGAGDDVITVLRHNRDANGNDTVQTLSISGGEGSDRVSVGVILDPYQRPTVLTENVTVDLGAGNDYLFLGNAVTIADVTLGSGQDRIVLGSGGIVTIRDFTVGAAGDVIDVSAEIIKTLSISGFTGNPFAGGFLRVIQQGSDTILALDYDGVNRSDQLIEFARLINVDSTKLTAYNLNGYAPSGAAITGVTINGTAGSDVLYGAAGNDVLNGLDGADRLDGSTGNDTIDGGEGNDEIEGGYGDDRIIGGAGNDLIKDSWNGSDTLSGGDGNDTIIVDHLYSGTAYENISISGGDGNDTVDYSIAADGKLSVDLGAGDDRITLRSSPNVGGSTLTLGGGSDVVAIDPRLASQVRGPIVITDFTTGNSGDQLNWTAYAQAIAGINGATFNPFADGYARLVQVGADTQLQLLRPFIRSTEIVVLVTFSNTNAASFTDFNLGTSLNLEPSDPAATIPATQGNDTITGTGGADVISGLGGNDILSGGAGNDTLRGNSGNDTLNGDGGNDTLDGGLGANTVDGGDGDDTITDLYGHDIITGGFGNDRISVTVSGNTLSIPTGNLNAGDGNDTIVISNLSEGRYDVNAGDGDDRIQIGSNHGYLALSLGGGRDTIDLPTDFDPNDFSTILIEGFQAGPLGDVINFDAFMASVIQYFGPSATWTPGQNPFALGYLELIQNGYNAALMLNVGAAGSPHSVRVVEFFGLTSAAPFTADNFGGFNPAPPARPQQVLNDSLTIAAGTTASISDVTSALQSYNQHYYYESTDGHAQFVNHGTVTTLVTTAAGFTAGFRTGYYGATASDGLFHNAADGRFILNKTWVDESGRLEGNRVYGVDMGSSQAVRFLNDGYFDVRVASGTAVGLLTGYTSGRNIANVNNGTMNIDSAYEAFGVIFAGYDGSFTNNGTLTVHGADYAVGIYSDQYIKSSIVNNGTIRVRTDPTSSYGSVGILLDEQSVGSPYTHLNTGTIDADIAFYVREQRPTGNIVDNLTNTGQIKGLIYLNDGNDSIVNSGTIDGRTLLGRGDDRYDGRDGFHTGSVEGGEGNDVLIGGSGAESLFGDLGNDTIIAGRGDDFVDGGLGSDSLDGGAGIDTLSYLGSFTPVTIDLGAGSVTSQIGEIDNVQNFEEVIGSRGGDRITGSGFGDILLGAGGDDSIDGAGGNDIVLGNTGNDTLTGGTGSDRFLFEVGDGNDIVVDYAADDTVEIYGAAAAQSITQVGSDVLITISASDSILVKNTTVAALTPNLSFSTAALGIVLPEIPDDPVLINQDLVIGSGAVYNLTNTTPITILAGRFVTASAVVGIAFDDPARGHGLWNAGSVALHVTSSGLDAIGITLDVTGSYENRVFNLPGGQIAVTADHGNATGIFAIETVYNQGLITADSLNGNATGIYDLGLVSAFVNAGTIIATAQGVARGVTQAFGTTSGPDTYFNSGRVEAHGGSASVGYEVHFAAHPAATQPRFVNSGSIVVSDTTAAIDSTGLLVVLSSSSTIWNSGTIVGDYALRVAPGTSYNVGLSDGAKVYNSGRLDGRVSLSNYADVLVNTNVINGDVFLGGGDDIFDGRQGTLNGTLDGYDGNDTLLTGSGDQSLFGGFGDDILSGGAGADQLTGGQGRDVFRFQNGFGADVILDFESGTAHDFIDISGYAAAQSIAQTGVDVLITFSATDTLLVRNAQVADVVSALRFGVSAIADQSIPSAPIAPSPEAAPTAPILTFTGTEGPDVLRGTAGPDVILARGGDDSIDGLSGLDQLYGGLGNDTYYTDQQGDLVFENAGEGTDTVISAANFYLYANIENLTLAGSGGNIFGVGNGLDNTILGNQGANTLLGGGGADTIRAGAGVDIVYGESGNDQLFGDADNDFLAGGIGDDTLDGGTGGDSLYGEDGNDTLIGGSDFVFDQLVGGAGDDVLRGDSGLGDFDYLYGNAGNDSFYVDTPADLVFEQVGEGTDTVYANINGGGYYLYANIENLVLLGNTPFGVGNDLANRLTGNVIGNYLLGGAGNDVLNGKGGNDVLFGEAGADTFVFERGTGGDVIGDFLAGTDKIDLSAFGFASFAAVQSAIGQNGSDSFINLGNGDFIVLNGVAATSLQAGDFILTAGQAAAGEFDLAVGPTALLDLGYGGDHAAIASPVSDQHHWLDSRFALDTPGFNPSLSHGGPLIVQLDFGAA